MPEKNNHNQPSLKSDAQNTGEGSAALVEVYKALKALAFYPEGHPLRDEITLRAFGALVNLMKGEGVSLVVGRGGLTIYGRKEKAGDSRLVKAFAGELFSREIQRITFLPELTIEDFIRFLSVLSMEPQKILAEGGISKLLKQRGFGTVIVNEIDISSVFTKRMVGQDSEGSVAEGAGTAEGEGSDWAGVPLEEETPPDSPDEMTIEELLSIMEKEPDADRYLLLSRRVVAKGQALKGEGDFDSLFPVVLRLLNQNSQERLSAAQREIALGAFRELASGEMVEHLLDHLSDKEFMLKEIVFMVLNRLEEEAVDEVLRRLIETDDPYYRKMLTTALLRIGTPALLPLIGMLRDGRSRVVRSVTAVLGEMSARDAVKGIALNVSHVDNRVRIESIRSLAMIGGKEATEALVGLVRGKDPLLRRQAVLWLGLKRNAKALPPLFQLIFEWDFRGKSFALKRDALRAVGRIGDHSALDSLFRLVRKRHIITPGRWEELKLIAVDIIAQFGGDGAFKFLEKMASRGGALGRKSSVVLNKRERGSGETND